MDGVVFNLPYFKNKIKLLSCKLVYLTSNNYSGFAQVSRNYSPGPSMTTIQPILGAAYHQMNNEYVYLPYKYTLLLRISCIPTLDTTIIPTIFLIFAVDTRYRNRILIKHATQS